MKIKTLAFLSFVLLFVFACKKDKATDPEPVPQISINDYFPMTVGNYWIYDIYKVDTSGVEEQYPYSDTIRIIAEEDIDGKTYLVAEIDTWLSTSNKKDTILYRDSSSYLIDSEGNFFLSLNMDESVIQSKTYNQTPYVSDYVMADSMVSFTVPAGTFDCIDFQGLFYSTDPEVPYENYPTRIAHNCYSKDVGIVYQNIFYAYSIKSNYERRLREYHLE